MFQKAVMGLMMAGCIELQRGINPPFVHPSGKNSSLDSITHLFFLHFCPERRFWTDWNILGKAEGSECSGLFQHMFLKVHIISTLCLSEVTERTWIFPKESKGKRFVGWHAWFLNILFLVTVNCKYAWPSPLACSSVKESERKVNFQVH